MLLRNQNFYKRRRDMQIWNGGRQERTMWGWTRFEDPGVNT